MPLTLYLTIAVPMLCAALGFLCAALLWTGRHADEQADLERLRRIDAMHGPLLALDREPQRREPTDAERVVIDLRRTIPSNVRPFRNDPTGA